MKLTHDVESQKKGPEEKGDDKKGFSKSPLTDRLMGKVLAIALAASTPAVIAVVSTSSCTFQPAGLEAEQDSGPDTDADIDTDSGHDSGPDADADIDAGHDSGPDADVDADVDAGHDAGPDADVDADVDAGPDADVDADVDSGIDAGPDADVDSGVDAGPDADVDAGPVACAVATTGSFDSTIGVGATETVGGYVFLYVGKSPGGDALMTITCGGNPVETSYACPPGVPTIIDVPIDGKRITITPHVVNPGIVSVGITVVNH
jgi:hypothetical protein